MENEEKIKPIVAMTMGDPAGIGPEICVLTALSTQVTDRVTTCIIGDRSRLHAAMDILHQAGKLPMVPQLRSIQEPREAGTVSGVIDVIDLHNVPSDLPWGELSATAGRCAYDYLERAVKLAVDQKIDAICTAPLNKEAWKLAGIKYPGHTEALAALSGSPHSAMMLVNAGLRVVHVTTHVSLKQAVDMATKDRVLERIRLTGESLARFGVPNPRIAVAGLNPHAGESGLFGDEEIKQIIPAVEAAVAEGFNVTGPLPPDSVYARAASGEFDVVIAMYHDQGHIAIKMLGFDTGINVTLGLPILRTSVDHGTAFDIAGKGIAREQSMIAAMLVAADFLNGGTR
ncbi:4-hydroxythreonine-4-phosphate dehydrogenase PdxA [Alicyclobacillus cycloheptanicus]|uniref:4-hydroxythreonine-4-phosphate dehydrogenase n=1 Tax=Alicyclobacillus cycloheptanicus TaxID=1457 RepID=A0ABT9XFH0_9BACL|nr:4-hydroxythreonine-4-phosphate dehydrogenase PdxA [Alicyclobacillus cycloheptanicus]MDQ0189039.1 4-hydroxythreonine-4-phosphate dehydrogenase [Alicyclobacillus cycloheptanicus]WDM00176.1 4-hydroxythreonine-4-phosphate dehydrogenase PdxA [Alicyclobacillus cycloheptanicus]